MQNARPRPAAENGSSSSLQLDEDLPFQRNQWRAERIGWVAMAAIIAAALAGVLGGGGLLSDTSGTTADGRGRVQYQRFARRESPTTLDISIGKTTSEHSIRLRVDERYLAAMSLRAINPHPSTTALADGFYTFAFDRSPGAVDARIQLQLEPNAIGSVQGWLAIDDGAPLRIKHFIFP